MIKYNGIVTLYKFETRLQAKLRTLSMKFSVVVPTYNRLALLKQTLESLFQQEYADYEIIVVNDGSTDGTDKYLLSLQKTKKIHYIEQQNKGPAASRNAGLRIAQGTYIAFTDDDCRVPSNWLKKFAEVFERSNVDIIGGAVRNACESNLFSTVSQEITNHFVNYFGKNGQSSAFLTSNNIAYRATALKGAGGFDERFVKAGGEERALNFKVLQNGGKSLLIPELIVDHYHAMNAKGFFRQQRNYGRGAYLLYNVIGKEMKRLPQRAPLSVYCGLVMSWLGKEPIGGIGKVFLFFTAQFNVLVGFFLELIRTRRKMR